MEVKVNVNIELGQNTINALAGILGGAVVTAKAAVKEAPAEEKEKTPAKVASKPAAKPAPKAVEEEAEEVEAKPVAAKPAPKAVAPKPAAKAKPVAEEEDFNELDEDAQLEAIKKEVTKHTKKGKTSDIKQLLGLFDVGRASDLDPATYGEFFDLVKRYGAGESAEDLVESYTV